MESFYKYYEVIIMVGVRSIYNKALQALIMLLPKLSPYNTQ